VVSRVLRPEPAQRQRCGAMRFSATLSGGPLPPHHLCFEVPGGLVPRLSERLDPFIIGLLQSMMREGSPVRVDGPVDEALLHNLAYSMDAGHRWRPERFGAVDPRTPELRSAVGSR
jgi:hypothetical protein